MPCFQRQNSAWSVWRSYLNEWDLQRCCRSLGICAVHSSNSFIILLRSLEMYSILCVTENTNLVLNILLHKGSELRSCKLATHKFIVAKVYNPIFRYHLAICIMRESRLHFKWPLLCINFEITTLSFKIFEVYLIHLLLRVILIFRWISRKVGNDLVSGTGSVWLYLNITYHHHTLPQKSVLYINDLKLN